MFKATVDYNNYDSEIGKVTIPYDEDHNQVLTITSEMDGEELITLIQIDIVEILSDTVVSSKKFTKVEMSNYIKLLQRLQREAVKFN